MEEHDLSLEQMMCSGEFGYRRCETEKALGIQPVWNDATLNSGKLFKLPPAQTGDRDVLESRMSAGDITPGRQFQGRKTVVGIARREIMHPGNEPDLRQLRREAPNALRQCEMEGHGGDIVDEDDVLRRKLGSQDARQLFRISGIREQLHANARVFTGPLIAKDRDLMPMLGKKPRMLGHNDLHPADDRRVGVMNESDFHLTHGLAHAMLFPQG